MYQSGRSQLFARHLTPQEATPNVCNRPKAPRDMTPVDRIGLALIFQGSSKLSQSNSVKSTITSARERNTTHDQSTGMTRKGEQLNTLEKTVCLQTFR